MKVVKTADYQLSEAVDLATGQKTEIKLPKSNVLSYSLEGGAAVIVRPSGTEPKIKVYVTSVGKGTGPRFPDHQAAGRLYERRD